MFCFKEKGGLDVSSLYALNRGLMLKWVWRFIAQSISLWAQVIKAIHGDDRKIGKNVKSAYPSIWLDIVHVMNLLKKQVIAFEIGLFFSSSSYGWCGTRPVYSVDDPVRKLIDDKMFPEVATKTRWVKVVPIKVNVHAWKMSSDNDLNLDLNLNKHDRPRIAAEC
ncbi:hypothetical protein Tco_0065190 [Tanacetum coccineum]